MITQNDLLDLKFVFCNIRLKPQFEMNGKIISVLIDALNSPVLSDNKIRNGLSVLDIGNKDDWSFIKTKNVYSHIVLIKDSYVYDVLDHSLKYLLKCIEQKEFFIAAQLADALHNLPVFICENSYKIPQSFFTNEVKWFRDNYDRNFLK